MSELAERSHAAWAARRLSGAGAVLAAGLLLISGAAAQSAPGDDPWPELKTIFFQDRPVIEDPVIVSLDAPARAEDAALVPMTLSAQAPPGDTRRVVKLSLIIDQNPVPLAGVFTLGEKADVTRISTRVRVNDYTNVRLIAELSDGSLHMATRYVKASGGCSAPAVKSLDEADAMLGQMKFRTFQSGPDGRREAMVMLRHPNNSGLQMDQVTRLYTPARYIDRFAVYQGGDLIFSVEGGISISEDPNFRFAYKPNGAGTIRVDARDIAGGHFSASWPADRGGA
jgi:sulfur-oxidizing protein SoxY